MIKIELIPDLSHCIETTAKKEFDRVAVDLVSSEEASDTLKEKIKILRSFLSTADFKKLRAESEPFLVEGCTVIFTLCSEDNSIKHTMTVVKG